MRLTVASYNTHSGVGVDRRFAPERIADVIAELDADIVALQELRAQAGGVDMLELLRERSGHHAVAGHTMKFADGAFGNGLLSRCPIGAVKHVELSVAAREPRGAIDARLDCAGTALRVIATHLGLRPSERGVQIERLLDVVRAEPALPTVLLGDLNEWFLRRRSLRWLHEHFGETPARATFPAPLPVLALDRCWVSPAAALCEIRVHRSRLARIASDHLPLVVAVELEEHSSTG